MILEVVFQQPPIRNRLILIVSMKKRSKYELTTVVEVASYSIAVDTAQCSILSRFSGEELQ